ncbi:MAG: hypothetical protein ABTQ32_01235 [Myxococcaceae bacterium]
MDKKNLAETRSIIVKLPTHLERSGTISSQLRTVEDGLELYDRVQQSELDLRTARETAESTLAEFMKSKQQLEAAEKKLTGLIRIGADVCTLFGIEIANDVLKADAADPQSSALHIAHYLARVPSIGKALAQGITEQRAEFLERELAIKSVETNAEAGSRELTGAYYRAVSVLAQAKAFLAVKGVSVRDRKPAPRRKRAVAAVPTVPAAPEVFVRPSSPAPAPTPLPMPEAA